MTFQSESERLRGPINAVLFDLGGVVFDIDTGGWHAQRTSELRVPLETLTASVNPIWPALQVGKITEEVAYSALCSALNLAEAPMPDDFWQLPFAPNTFVVDFVRQLQPNYRVAFLTNAYPTVLGQMRMALVALGIQGEVYASSEIGVMKGSGADVYRTALTLVETQPNSTIFVDDVKSYVDEATQVGLQGIHFTGDVDSLRESFRNLGVEI